MTLDLFRIISIISVFQSLFIATFILSNRKERYFGNTLLAYILILFSLQIVIVVTTSIGVWQKFIHYHITIFHLQQTALILAPLFYFYVLSIFDQKEGFNKWDIFHFVPFILFFIILLIYLPSLKNFIIWDSVIMYYSSGLIILQSLIYIVLPFIKIKNKQVKLADLFLVKGDTQKFWLNIFIVGFIVLWLIKLHVFILGDVWKLHGICPSTNNLYFLIFFFLISFLWYISLHNPEILRKIVKYKNTQLSAEEIMKIAPVLYSYIKENKPYLDSELTLAKLAEQLCIPSRCLSQFINEQTQKNFNNFINSYRIEESKKLFLKKQTNEKNISEIFYAVGFNSRSSFNTAFKKHTGQTPSEFRNRHE